MASDIIRPDGTLSLTGWEANPHLKLDDVVTETDTDPLSNSGEYVASTTAGDSFELSFADLNIGTDSVTSVVAWVRWRAGLGTLSLDLRKGTTSLATTSIASGSTVGTGSATYNGSLTQAEVNDLRVVISKDTSNATASRVGWVFLYVNHSAGATTFTKAGLAIIGP